MFDHNLAIVDVETTGTHPQRDRIIEVGVLLVNQGTVVRRYSQLVNPGQRLNPFISRLTGITDQELQAAPAFHEIASELYTLLSERVFVAHFARFDFGFLSAEYERLGKKLELAQLCSLRLSKLLYPQYRSHGLSKIIARLGIQCDTRHRALADATVIWELFKQAQRDFSPEELTHASQQVLKRQRLPAYLSPDRIRAIPNCPGVYTFLDARQRPLYIGKSTQLRKRVMSHFRSDASPKELAIAHQIRDVVVLPTAGELHALLTESQLVKTQLPVYNRQLRKQEGLYVLRLQVSTAGYHSLSWKRQSEVRGPELASILGVYRSSQAIQADVQLLQEKHQLCWRLCGLEHGHGACFGYHLGQCSGACVGKEPAAAYNARLSQAVKDIDIGEWPFPGVIQITEQSEASGLSASHFFDQWCFLGSTPAFDANQQLPLRDQLLFDLDVYRILKAYLANPLNLRQIQRVTESS